MECDRDLHVHIKSYTINWSWMWALQVLQHSVDNRLNLYSDAKERINPVAQLAVFGLSSQPVDHDDNGHRKQASSDVGLLVCICTFTNQFCFRLAMMIDTTALSSLMPV